MLIALAREQVPRFADAYDRRYPGADDDVQRCPRAARDRGDLSVADLETLVRWKSPRRLDLIGKNSAEWASGAGEGLGDNCRVPPLRYIRTCGCTFSRDAARTERSVRDTFPIGQHRHLAQSSNCMRSFLWGGGSEPVVDLARAFSSQSDLFVVVAHRGACCLPLPYRSLSRNG